MCNTSNPENNFSQFRYHYKADDAAGMRHAFIEDAIFTEICTPLLAPQFPLGIPEHILDIACGPGVWARTVAHTYPQVQVIGIDNRQLMIDYACMATDNARLSNASFLLADFYHLYHTFSPAQFDFIHVRNVLWYLGKAKWDLVNQWCKLLKPGGMIRLTDWEVATTNSLAFAQLTQYLLQAFYAYGRLENEDRVGVVRELIPLLRHTGIEPLAEQAHDLDFSTGAYYHHSYVQNIVQIAISLEDFIVGSGKVDRQTFRRCRQQAIKELDLPTFSGSFSFLSAWGIKK